MSLVFTMFAYGATRVKLVTISKGTEKEDWQQFYYGEESALSGDRVVVWFNKGTEVLRWLDEHLIPALNPQGQRLRDPLSGTDIPLGIPLRLALMQPDSTAVKRR